MSFLSPLKLTTLVALARSVVIPVAKRRSLVLNDLRVGVIITIGLVKSEFDLWCMRFDEIGVKADARVEVDRHKASDLRVRVERIMAEVKGDSRSGD